MTTQDNHEAASALSSAILNLPFEPIGYSEKEKQLLKLGHRSALSAAAELVAASASQSSTAGAASNTSDILTEAADVLAENNWRGDLVEALRDLAHVARQRQECPLGCTGPEQGGSGCAAVTGDCAMGATPSAAVAEGVDTDDRFACLLHHYAVARAKVGDDSASREAATMELNELTAHVDGLLAQQREAGRREEPMRKRVEDFAKRGGWSDDDGEGAFEFVQRISYEQGFADRGRSEYDSTLRVRIAELESALAERDATALRVAQCAGEFARESALSRQPAGEGLMEALRELTDASDTFMAGGVAGLRHAINKARAILSAPVAAVPQGEQLTEDRLDALLRMLEQGIVTVEAAKAHILAAVPPAKAEGMSDTKRLDFIEANTDLQLKLHKRRWSFVGFTNYEFEVHKTARAAIDAAILAQQAKKGGAA